jgi:hypothetical protein
MPKRRNGEEEKNEKQSKESFKRDYVAGEGSGEERE